MRPAVIQVAAGSEEWISTGADDRVIFLDTRSTVNVTIRDRDRQQQFYLTPGGAVIFGKGFDGLFVSHDGASDTLITLYVGGRESIGFAAQVSGNIQIVGGSQNTANPPIIDTVNSIINPLTPRTLVTQWGAPSGTTLQTLVTPAANTNGIRVDADGVVVTGSTGQCRFMAKTSAPASIGDMSARTINWYHITTSARTGGSPQYPFIIPAGEGLYFQADATSIQATIDYEVL